MNKTSEAKMHRYLVVIFLFFIFDCSENNNPINNSDSHSSYQGFFNALIDDQQWIGDGVAFLKGETSLHFRGLSGNSGHFEQIDIVINDTASSSYRIPIARAGLVAIDGGDMVSILYKSQGAETDSISYQFNKSESLVTGSFMFKGFSRIDSQISVIEGNFKLEVGLSGSPWTCGFRERNPTNDGCGFIKY